MIVTVDGFNTKMGEGNDLIGGYGEAFASVSRDGLGFKTRLTVTEQFLYIALCRMVAKRAVEKINGHLPVDWEFSDVTLESSEFCA